MALVSAILTDARYEIKDAAKTNYSDAELLRYFNEGIRRLVARICKDWPAFWLNSGQAYLATSNIVALTNNYALPATYYSIIQVTLTDTVGDITIQEPIDLSRSLDADEENGYMLINNRLYLYPTPATNVANGLAIYYVGLPATLGAGDVAPFSTYFYDAEKEYVVLKAKARQGEALEDFSQFYQLVARDAAPVMERTNRSAARHGMNMNWRDMV